MSSILDEYKKQSELDKQKTEIEAPEGVNYTPEQFKRYQEEVKKLREDPNDIENVYRKFHETHRPLSEEELDGAGFTKIEEIKQIVVKRAYCPNCKREITSKVPMMFNPYTLEKIAKYNCECGSNFNMEHSYPRIMYIDNEGKEINVFND